MTSVGIMASGVNVSACTQVLSEPFNNLTAWTTAGAPSIVTGRTGTAAQAAGTTDRIRYTIPATNENDTVTVGFAYRATVVTSGQRRIVGFLSDTASLEHCALFWTGSSGVLNFQRGATVLGTSAASAILTNTWCYVEMQAKLHDTAGFGIIRVNGVDVINVSGVDTKNAGIKTVFDTVSLSVTLTSNTAQWDDLYISTGSACTFQGDHTIP